MVMETSDEENDEVKIVYNKFYEIMLEVCADYDPIMVSSTMLAVSQKLVRTVHDDESYERIMYYVSKNAMKIEPFWFDDEENTTYH